MNSPGEFVKTTRYSSGRFFGATWPETKRDFLDVWVPAQNRAALDGLAPRVLSAAADDRFLVLVMEKIEGKPLSQAVEEWRDDPSVDDDEMISRLETVLRRAKDFHRRLLVSTGADHPDWAARNVMVRAADDRWFAIDFENWMPGPTSDDADQVFSWDLAQKFQARPKIYRFLKGRR